MQFIDAFTTEEQSLRTKRGLVRTKVSSAMRCALWKLIFNYGSDRGLLRPPGWVNGEFPPLSHE